MTSLAVRFVLDWNYAAKENLFLEDRLFEIPEYERDGRSLVQIVSSGPDSKYDSVRDNYLKMIQMAEHHIYLQTPYFIPDQAILDSLKIAAKSGVDVRIMILASRIIRLFTGPLTLISERWRLLAQNATHIRMAFSMPRH